MTTLEGWQRQAFADSPEPAAVLDPSGTIVAVNVAWSDTARAGGAEAACGVGIDYLGVCRVGMAHDAPGARRAHADVTAVLTARTPRASSVYPCAGPRGLRWFRSDAFVLGRGKGVCIRHLDLTDAAPAPGLRLHRVAVSPDRLEPGDANSFHDGLDELLQSAGPEVHVVVLVAAVDEPDHRLRQTALAIAQLVIEHAEATLVASAARVDLVAPVGPTDIGITVSAPSLAEATRAADHIRVTADRRLPHRTVWGLAVGAGGGEHASTLVDRARRAVQDVAGGSRRPATFPADVDSVQALHRSARRLSDAVAEFDAALEQGLALSELVVRDREVRAAENACLAAAATRRGAGVTSA